MLKITLRRFAIVMAAGLALPTGMASAQMMAPNGSEIVGQPVRVETAGTSNTVYFNRGGTARIVGATGEEANANWAVQGNNLCLSSGSVRECWPYQEAFRQGQPVQLTSDCGATSRFTALSTNAMPVQAPPVQVQRAGERG